MKRNHPRNHSPSYCSNYTKRNDHNIQLTVQYINKNVNVSFDMHHPPENIDLDSYNIISISSRDH